MLINSTITKERERDPEAKIMISSYNILFSILLGVSGAARTGSFVPWPWTSRPQQFQEEVHNETPEDAKLFDTTAWVDYFRTAVGPPDKFQTARFMIYLIGAFALLYELTPGVLFNTIGGKHSQLNHRLVQTYGTGVFGVIIMMYCVVLNGMTLAEAYQLSEIPWIIECLRNSWKEGRGGNKAVGYNKREQTLRLALSALFLYSMTQHHPTAAMKTATMLWLLVGLYVIVQPEAAARTLFGHFPTYDATSEVMIRMIGFNMLAHGGFAGVMLFGDDVDPFTAFGVGYSSWFFKLLVQQFVTDDVQKAGADIRMIYFWMAVHGSVVATMLLPLIYA